MKQNHIRRVSAAALCVLLCAAPLQGQQDLLGLRPGARATGMGGSLVALADDATAIYWNPALLPTVHDFKLTVGSFNPFYINFGGACYFLPPRSTIGFSLARTGPDGDGYQLGSGAWGARLSPSLYFGANVNLLNRNEESWPTAGFGFLFAPRLAYSRAKDEGGWLSKLSRSKLLADRVRVAVAVGNIPLVLSDIDHEVRFGISYRAHESLPLVQAAFHLHRGEDSSHLGVALPLAQWITVMAGVENLDSNYLAGGCSVRWKNLDMHLVYSSLRERVLVTLSANIGEDARSKSRQYFERGAAQVRQGNNRAALANFQSAQALGKTNGELQEIIERLEKRIESEDAIIDSLLSVAKYFQSKEYYISATINYLKILKLYPRHRESIYHMRAIKPKVDIFSDQLYRGAVDYYNRGEYRKAEEVFKTIVLVQEEHREAHAYLNQIEAHFAEEAKKHYLQGLSLYGNGQLADARTEFERALAIDADHDAAQRLLDEVSERMAQRENLMNAALSQAIRAERTGLTETAYLKYQEVLAQYPDNDTAQRGVNRLRPIIDNSIRTLLDSGKRYYENGNYENARSVFRQVLQSSPRHGEATAYLNRINQTVNQQVEGHYQEGLSLYNQKKYSEAIDEFNRALALNPRHRESANLRDQAMANMDLEKLEQRGNMHYAAKQYVAAWEYYNQVLSKDPDNTEVNDKLEDCQVKMRELVEKLFNEGMAAYSERNYKQAIEKWDKVLEINPNHPGSREYKKKANEQLKALMIIRTGK